jgi:hypothetical protein
MSTGAKATPASTRKVGVPTMPPKPGPPLDVPAGVASNFVLSGGTGDADLYVKADSTPTTSSYDCRPYLRGNNETCNIAAKTTAIRIYVMLRGYSAYTSASLKGCYSGP